MNKNIKQEFVWILIVALFVAGFFLLQASITGYTVSQTTILEDIHIHAETPISPTLQITIPTEQLTGTTPDLTYSYIQIKPITEQYKHIDIIFKVSNSWIINNNLDKSEIALYIFDTEWKQLPTGIEKQAAKYTHYKSRTEELGLFAVAKATKKLHIEEPTEIEKITIKERILSPLTILIIIVLAVILIIELFSLIKHKFKFALITLIFAIMVLGLIIQQPLTREILTYGLIPISIIALIASILLNILLNKLRKLKSYSYIRNIIISILIAITFIISITAEYTKEILIYGVLPIILVSIITATISTLMYYVFRKPKKKLTKKQIGKIEKRIKKSFKKRKTVTQKIKESEKKFKKKKRKSRKKTKRKYKKKKSKR